MRRKEQRDYASRSFRRKYYYSENKISPEEHASTERSVDKFADARRAKKKEKRKRHRAKLKRQHTSG